VSSHGVDGHAETDAEDPPALLTGHRDPGVEHLPGHEADRSLDDPLSGRIDQASLEPGLLLFHRVLAPKFFARLVPEGTAR
jgi:hypothetical protein